MTATQTAPTNGVAETSAWANTPLPARIQYHEVAEQFADMGVNRASWKSLVEAVFPLAQSLDSVVLALSYCKARRLDPFKRVVHIVPIYDSKQRKMVDTVWPGIGELRTTAFRTGVFAGRDETQYGPDREKSWDHKPNNGPPKVVTVTFPEWAQITVHRMVAGQRVAFQGPRVRWLETYATMGKEDCPNSMWQRRPYGQLEKCAEAAALRAAFPEELGSDMISDEVQHSAPRFVESTPARIDLNTMPLDDEPGAAASEPTDEPAATEPEVIDEPSGLDSFDEIVADLIAKSGCGERACRDRLFSFGANMYESPDPRDWTDEQMAHLASKVASGDVGMHPTAN